MEPAPVPRPTAEDGQPRHYATPSVLAADDLAQRAGLTRQEQRLLRVLLDQADRVLTRTILLERGWGPDYPGDPSTLGVHMVRLRRKLQRAGITDIGIRTVRGLGYILESGSPNR